MAEHMRYTAAYWHERAAEARAVAENMATAETRRMMMAIAADYDRLSERARTRELQDSTHAHHTQ
jgi:hypothetical protein